MRDDTYEPKHIHKMTPGWLFPYLVQLDEIYGSQRWSYWGRALDLWAIPPEPIPPIDFRDQPEREVVKHVVGVLEHAVRYAGIRHSEAFESWVVWLLHGLGDPEFREHKTAVTLPDLRHLTPRVLDAWYETFNLGLLLMHPADYLAHLAQGGENKGYNPYAGAGFFATPMSVCRMMAQVTFAGTDPAETKTASLCDPCCGTGSLLLAASNYAMNLYGNDISLSMVRCTRLNAWLYIPWAVFWPDFSRFGGPNPQQLREMLFAGARVPGMTPDPDLIPPVPLPVNILQGELKQTASGQYILPLFDEITEVKMEPTQTPSLAALSHGVPPGERVIRPHPGHVVTPAASARLAAASGRIAREISEPIPSACADEL